MSRLPRASKAASTQCKACRFRQTAQRRSETIPRLHSHSFLTCKATHLPRNIDLSYFMSLLKANPVHKRGINPVHKRGKNPLHKRVLARVAPCPNWSMVVALGKEEMRRLIIKPCCSSPCSCSQCVWFAASLGKARAQRSNSP